VPFIMNTYMEQYEYSTAYEDNTEDKQINGGPHTTTSNIVLEAGH
jgi:hypothetical protein